MASIDFYDTPSDTSQSSSTAPPLDMTPVSPATSQGRGESGSFDYGNGIVARKVDGGWLYPTIRPQPFQDLLSDQDVQDQQALAKLRAGGGKIAEDDASAMAGLRSAGSMQQAITNAQAGRDNYSIDSPGFQFNDPYTRQLEDVARQQIGSLSQPQANPMLDRVLAFLSDRFNTLSQTPGYSPEDLAVMRTQALDPIEQDRAASQQRALEHAARAGFLPTSGITSLAPAPNGGVEPIDATYDRLRAAAQRDLAINAITKRNQDLGTAVQLGQLAGVTIPQTQRSEDQQRRQELVNLATILYNLPRQAQQDAMAVVNGTENANSVFSQGLQSQQAALQQQQADAQRWAQIGQALAQMVF